MGLLILLIVPAALLHYEITDFIKFLNMEIEI